jgi:hypothetical protein
VIVITKAVRLQNSGKFLGNRTFIGLLVTTPTRAEVTLSEDLNQWGRFRVCQLVGDNTTRAGHEQFLHFNPCPKMCGTQKTRR